MKRNIQKITYKLFVSVVALSAIVLGVPVQAADLSFFQAGNIMSDAVMENSITMTQPQIQAFLEQKVPSCDTWGSKPSEYGGGTRQQYAIAAGWGSGPYTCLRDYSTDGKQASQIIYDVSQKYRINPQVLIVLLQKEQGLVTDEWPIASQYRSATGYGCPDTAACDSAYYGLINQLDWSGKMFRAILDNSVTWYTPYTVGDNYVRWNPQSSCGGSTITIQNRATAALYSYTPYQPNTAALSSGYGMGDSCSAYGNRNFWLYFTDWFGTTQGIEGETNGVYRLWNPVRQKHFYTANVSEANVYLSSGWRYDGVAFHSDPNGVSVYRLYNTNTKSHFYTKNTAERDIYVAAGWKNDGAVFKVPSSGSPVYRMFHRTTGAHFLTKDINEMNAYVKAGWVYDGAVFTSNDYLETQSVYRLYNKSTGTHILISSTAELGAYVAAGWINDGVVFRSDSEGVPVYRLYSSYSKSHFFTKSTTERDVYVATGWKNDGAVFKSSSSGTPVYRLYSLVTKSHFFTTSTAEYNAYVAAGWHGDGIVFYAPDTVSVYRMFSDSTDAYMLATGDARRDFYARNGWESQGKILNGLVSGSSPIYQLYNSATGSYFYTANAEERSVYLGAGWTGGSRVFYAATPADTPIYRLYSPTDQVHFLTSSSSEVATYTGNGWINDGIVFYTK